MPLIIVKTEITTVTKKASITMGWDFEKRFTRKRNPNEVYGLLKSLRIVIVYLRVGPLTIWVTVSECNVFIKNDYCSHLTAASLWPCGAIGWSFCCKLVMSAKIWIKSTIYTYIFKQKQKNKREKKKKRANDECAHYTSLKKCL